MSKRDIYDWLDEIQVHDPDEPHAELNKGNCPKGWWAVSHPDKSIVAYFLEERAAFAYRLYLINREMNGDAQP